MDAKPEVSLMSMALDLYGFSGLSFPDWKRISKLPVLIPDARMHRDKFARPAKNSSTMNSSRMGLDSMV
jgi:hypothetical protein